MLRADYAARVEEIKRRAHGHWTEILSSLGVDDRILGRRNGPCPLCGGTDRFQYTDRFGEGNYHCRGCGPGGGFKLLQAVKGCDFNTALHDVEQNIGTTVNRVSSIAREPGATWMRKLAKQIWDETRPVEAGDEVSRYLTGRGLALTNYPKVLRVHDALGYYERDAAGKSRKVGVYPAMLAAVEDAAGQPVTLHRTYLLHGRKLISRDARKVLSAGINGAAVRLFEATDELALCEGIETALAVYLATGKPVWAALSAGNLERVVLPSAVRRVHIYADNDSDGDFTGQAYAYALARRLRLDHGPDAGRQVQVFLPRTPGADWADVWLHKTRRLGDRQTGP